MLINGTRWIWKWTNAFKDAVKERCELKTIGFNAAGARPELKDEIRFARRFEPGHLSCLSFGSLKFSLDFLCWNRKKIKIEERNKKLAEKAKQEFEALGLYQKAQRLAKNLVRFLILRVMMCFFTNFGK